MVPGGGQNDTWHSLSCRGRYAGEIRIELTYYDTRPRDVNTDERRQPAQINGQVEDTKASLSGPRQPRPVKRRPLPADPTGSVRPTQPIQTPPTHQQISSTPTQSYTHSPDDYQFYTPPQETAYNQYQDSQASDPILISRSQEQNRNVAAPIHPQPSYSSSPAYLGNSFEAPQASYEDPGQVENGSATYTKYATNQGYDDHYGQSSHISKNTHDSYAASYRGPVHSASYSQHSPAATPSGISPKAMQPQTPPSTRAAFQHSRSSLSHSISADVEREYSPIGPNPMGVWPTSQDNDNHNDDSPPPPPAHGASISKPLPQNNEYSEPQSYSQASASTALNKQVHRDSPLGSPLSHVQSTEMNSDYGSSVPPSQSHVSTYPPDSIPSQDTHQKLRQHRSLSPVRDRNQVLPPSLVPGYEPSIAVNEPNRDLHEECMSSRQDHTDQPPPLYHQNSAPQPQSRNQPYPTRGVEIVQERRPHRNSAPVIRPMPLNPASRTPIRKPVSPQPDSAPAERRRSEQPFSPDSFNAFNPSVESASSSTQTGARYNTPDQAREASIQHDRDVKRGDGPIIGNDGRIIDPSDHLPTDTWAPEPEQKTPRKGPEVTVRFRHSPQGAQPMPQGGRRPPNEPRTMSSPLTSHSVDNSPAAMNRARMQKRSRMGLSQPNSSPALPTLDTVSSSPQYSMHRSPAAVYPLRERENGAHSSSSPTYGNRSHHQGSIPPPIPGKIPIGGEQEDWDSSALSEEMSRIDIGVGAGRKTRVQRYGF